MAKKTTKTNTNPDERLNKVLELAEANAKDLRELKEKTEKSFMEYHNTLMLLKERNRLR